jgi:two-component system CheB/CheR fusion protein
MPAERRYDGPSSVVLTLMPKRGRSREKLRASGRRPASGNGAEAARVPERARAPEEVPHHPGFPVVGVGASAGGLEAFTTLLRGIPGDTAVAMVLVQHLARGHESLLPDLLRPVTTLRVVQARNGVRIEPRHVYVIPPDARMTVTDGHLAVGPRDGPAGGGDAPVDILLRSMAEHYREKAIGVILSGGAHDGAVGIREIKANGGITMAQEPAEAGMDSMPRSAIATGAVDLVLPVAQIADQLARLAGHPFLVGPAAPAPAAVPESDHLRRIFHLLRRASGVDFTHYKSPTVMRRIQRRMALHRHSTLESYLGLLQEAPAEVESLYEDILINVTSFFREPESFEVLKERILPTVLQSQNGDTPIRLWVPGCSSGEEVYSLAIALHELLGDKADATAVQIFGTDVSQKMIDRARAGIYPDSIAGEMTAERLRRFFVKLDGGFRISKAIRERCVFARQDITRDPPFSKLHLVMCRNLLIYLGTGFLMLGRSETTGAHAELFSLVDKRFKVYRKKPDAAVGEMDFSVPIPQDPATAHPKQRRAPPPEPAHADWDLQGEANRMILDRYGPPGVIVDNAMRIVRTRGRTSPYLELPTGDATLDVLKLARQGLLFGLRNAVEESRGRGITVRKEGLRVAVNGDVRLVNLEVTPMGTASDRHYLVVFEDAAKGRAKKGPAGKAKGRPAPRKAQADAVVRQLEEELEASRQYLQSIIHDLEAANEELQSANEEVLSSNEELQSTNEELDTAKEELQSTNEELSTLNEELHGRNEELSRVNSDLVNLLASVHIPIVIVTADLKIRRFTPAAEKLLNLIAADVGRPIAHIKPNIHCPDLEAVITDVIDSVTIREREVSDQDGVAYTLRVRPYKNIENRIDGAVLTLFDASDASHLAAGSKVARASAEAIISIVREPILLLSGDLRVQKANPAFLEEFRLEAGEVEGKQLQDVGERQWDRTDLREAMLALPLRESFGGFVLEAEWPGLGRRKKVIEGRRIVATRPEGNAIVLVIRDGPGDGT